MDDAEIAATVTARMYGERLAYLGQQYAKLTVENRRLRAIIQEALDAAPGHDAKKFMLMPHALAESGWFKRACASLNIQKREDN